MELNIQLITKFNNIQKSHSFFFLEYAGELHIIALREKKNGPVQEASPHSSPSCGGAKLQQGLDH
jgi:hypothetical protein